ncbi:hypothetical protein AB0F77_20605 [Streptomyces sp. NPDC026672]
MERGEEISAFALRVSLSRAGEPAVGAVRFDDDTSRDATKGVRGGIAV